MDASAGLRSETSKTEALEGPCHMKRHGSSVLCERVTPRAANSVRVKDKSRETETVPFSLKPCPFSALTRLPSAPRARDARALKRSRQMVCLNQQTKHPQPLVQKEVPLSQRQRFLTPAHAKMDTVNGQLPLPRPPPPDSCHLCVTSWGSIPYNFN